MTAFVDWLEEQLRLRNMTASDLARRAGVSKTTVFHWLSGEYRPSPRIAGRLADALGVDPQTILVQTGYAPPDSPTIDLSKVDYRAAIRAQEPPDVADRIISVINALLEVERGQQTVRRRRRSFYRVDRADDAPSS